MNHARPSESSWDTAPVVYDDSQEWTYGETADRPSLLQQLIPRGAASGERRLPAAA